MKINILTIFPELFSDFRLVGIVAKAIKQEKIEFNIIDIREYTENKHNKVDDYVFGGGEGMLFMCQPVFSAIRENNLEDSHLIYPSPKGVTLNQKKLEELAEMSELTILCARYEGVDQRVIDTFVDEEISIGDYIISGSELAAQIIIDGVSRLIPNVINNQCSHLNDSFSNGLLEHPQYTRPAIFEGISVPEVLLSGNHAIIDKWKEEKSLEETFFKRPDLLDKITLSPEQATYLAKLRTQITDKKDK
ncbi:MAG: tRNA (guanosine(37)-N1)-methyltransferase TrmD [Mycoplasmatales bacterium]